MILFTEDTKRHILYSSYMKTTRGIHSKRLVVLYPFLKVFRMNLFFRNIKTLDKNF